MDSVLTRLNHRQVCIGDSLTAVLEDESIDPATILNDVEPDNTTCFEATFLNYFTSQINIE
jgi:hypothetical protein